MEKTNESSIQFIIFCGTKGYFPLIKKEWIVDWISKKEFPFYKKVPDRKIKKLIKGNYSQLVEISINHLKKDDRNDFFEHIFRKIEEAVLDQTKYLQ